MGKPLMIQLDDDIRIEKIKNITGAKSKVDVIRAGLTLLEENIKRSEKIKRWEKAAKIIGQSGLEELNDFNYSGRFKNIP
jgi:hypothetical protein